MNLTILTLPIGRDARERVRAIARVIGLVGLVVSEAVEADQHSNEGI